MKKLTFLFLSLSLALASCQNKYPDLEDGVYAEFITNKGTFVAKLYHEKTPLTVANFVGLAEGTNKMVDSTYTGKKYYNGLTFHRVMKDFMIQGGDPMGTGSGGPGYKFPDETDPELGLKHDRKGILSMANSGPATNGSQFFVTLKDTPWLDGIHTVFGEVVIGQEVVDSIGSVKVTPGNNRPEQPVTMQEVNIIRKGAVKIASFSKQMESIEKEKLKEQEAVLEAGKENLNQFEKLKDEAETLDSGLSILFTEKGDGVQPERGSKVKVNYAGYLASDGTLFDSNISETAKKNNKLDKLRLAANQYVPMAADYSPDARLIAGFKEGLMLMSVGDKATLFIPSHLGYGAGGYPPVIPPNADLVFELELVEVVE
ncbi:peptidylprolyl isomerase [Jejudonia soesokkakensis]|uniref:peptidylprolyl isomerase n=1 Tax=Jejudonia soesokkakensis TaxID=1323432 RepID=A0ABW2MS58_9FLAO